MHKAQVRLEAGESSIGIEIEIGIEIDSVQFCASVRLDTDTDFDFDFDFNGAATIRQLAEWSLKAFKGGDNFWQTRPIQNSRAPARHSIITAPGLAGICPFVSSVKSGGFPYALYFFKIKAALVPPKPKELVMA
jgi:hypothetical protein